MVYMDIKDRVIPTLHGEDADRFLKEAEWGIKICVSIVI